jgi:Leucine-rich repeat (LRR) protein
MKRSPFTKNYLFYCLTTVILLFLLQESVKASIIPPEERAALDSLFLETDGSNWDNSDKWGGTLSEDKWYGITLNDDNTVRSIILPDNNLNGPIPAYLSKLTKLQNLVLSGNSLRGNIPGELFNLANLSQLQLSDNQLSGTISPTIGMLSKLSILDLSGNQLYGSIPSQIGDLTNLTTLNLSNNQLNGTIPISIGNLANLTKFEIQNNKISGTIPTSIGNLKQLTNLSLYNNQLIGSIPEEIYELTKLQGLSLMNNNFQGGLSSSVGNLTRLVSLNLHNCGLSGEIPAEIGYLGNITTFNISHNNFTGSIPPQLSNLTNLQFLNLEANQLSGSIPDALSGFASLIDVRIDSNLIDNIPNLTNVSKVLYCNNNRLDFGDLEPNMSLLSKLSAGNYKYSPQAKFGEERWESAIENYHYTIIIPCNGKQNHYSWFKNGTTIYGPDASSLYINKVSYADIGTYYVEVKNNLVPGLTLTSYPVHLEVNDHCLKKDSLVLVALYNLDNGANWIHKENWLKGRVNTWWGIIADSCSVVEINLNDDSLKGQLPSTIGNLTNLRKFNVRNNQLSGDLPPSFWNLTNLEVLYLSLNKFTGTIPDKIGRFSLLNSLTVDENNFNGNLPDSLWTLTRMVHLNLHSNKFSGSLSPNIGNLSLVNYLDVSHNTLTGVIPQTIGSLSGLQTLRMDDNQLENSIPEETGDLTNLEYLTLSNNQLSESIPPSIGNLIKLKELNLSNNDLTGNIPTEIGNLTSLEFFALSVNKLSGTIPNQLVNLTKLKEFRIDHNTITGGIPSGFGSFTSLESLDFEDNLIDEIQNLSNIDTLLLCEMNHLTFEDFELNLKLKHKTKLKYDYSPQLRFGREYDTIAYEDAPFKLSIPCKGAYNKNFIWYKDNVAIPDIPDTSVLIIKSVKAEDMGTYYLTLENDSVPNLLLQSMPVHLNHIKPHCIKQDSLALITFYYATNGPHWIHQDNWLTGPVNSWYGIKADSCNVLEIKMDHDSLIGTIPPEIGVFTKLQQLSLSRNYLSNTIPNEIYRLTTLQTLNLSYNQLNGEIQNSIDQLASLQILFLNNNQFEGNIPSSIGKLVQLRQLDLSNNAINGTIPSGISGLKSIEVINLGHNLLGGTLPDKLWDLTTLKRLLLNDNQFEGEVSSSAGELTVLKELRIDTNSFAGSVPATIGKLTELHSFQLTENLFDELPQLTNIDSLLFCSFNYFTFEDFERNLDLLDQEKLSYIYSPQYKFGREYDTIAFYKYPFTLSIPCGGAHNHYQWFKNDTLKTAFPDSYTMTLKRVKYSDAGVYYIKVTNDVIPNLELTSLPVTVTVEKGPPLEISLINLVIIDGSHEPNFIIDNIDDYPENRLIVLNKWGKVVYDKSGYNNELNLTSYPEGTYYFILNYTTVNGKKQIKNFVDVIKK